jgi:hypothetical protein
LALIGAGLGLAQWRKLAPIYIITGSVAIVQSIMAVNTRYRLPLDPYLILFASIAVTRFLSKEKRA